MLASSRSLAGDLASIRAQALETIERYEEEPLEGRLELATITASKRETIMKKWRWYFNIVQRRILHLRIRLARFISEIIQDQPGFEFSDELGSLHVF